MPQKTRPKEQLLDLLLLGLTWLSEDSPGSYSGWMYNGIFQTIRLVGAVSEEQYKFVATGRDGALNQCLMDNGALAFPRSSRPVGRAIQGQPLHTAPVPQATCTKLVGGSEKKLVILVNRPLFDKAAIVTPRGFPLLATDRGREYAHGIAAQYERDLSLDSFRTQWRLHAKAMRGMHANTRTADG